MQKHDGRDGGMDAAVKRAIISTHGPLIAAAENSKGYAAGKDIQRSPSTSSAASAEQSQPPSPTPGPPPNFGIVAPGLYRSGFPQASNIEHLEGLKLKTILTLVVTEHSPITQEYVHSNGIRHVRVIFPAHKEPGDAIPLEAMTMALEIALNRRNYPLLVHCNKGKHRTGCLVACLRKMENWPMESIIDEYRSFAGSKARTLDERYIERLDQVDMADRIDTLVMKIATEKRALMTPPDSVKSDAPRDAREEGEQEPCMADLRPTAIKIDGAGTSGLL